MNGGRKEQRFAENYCHCGQSGHRTAEWIKGKEKGASESAYRLDDLGTGTPGESFWQKYYNGTRQKIQSCRCSIAKLATVKPRRTRSLHFNRMAKIKSTLRTG